MQPKADKRQSRTVQEPPFFQAQGTLFIEAVSALAAVFDDAHPVTSGALVQTVGRNA